jgi:aldose 1-epimerase
MRFESIISGKNKIILKDNSSGTFAEIFSFGALLNKFSILKNGIETNLINGFENIEDARKNITNGFKSAKLAPFVCRVKNGEYVFENKNFKLDKFYLSKEAIHGLMFDAPFEIKETGSDNKNSFIKFEFHYVKKNEGFPFSFKMEITYELKKENALSIITKITNTGDTNMPVSDGWHPYFKLGEKVNDLEVQLNTNQILEFDERLLPTGKISPFTKFNSSEIFGETKLDHCFLLNEDADAGCIIRDEKNNLELKIIADKSYPYLQIYTPDDRKSIAIENLSSAPDSFNNGMGLIIAKPNGMHQFKTTYQISVL